MARALILLKSTNNRQACEDCAWQCAQLAEFCIANKVKPIGCVVSHAGINDMIKRVQSADKTKRFEYVVIYSPAQISKSEQDYQDFVNTMTNNYQVKVIPFRH